MRARIEAAFGPDALAGPRPVPRRLPLRRRLRRKFRRRCSPVAGPGGAAPPASGSTPPPPGKPPSGHIPFTLRAKKSLQLAQREAHTRQDNYPGPEHIALALLRLKGGAVPLILARLGVQPGAPRQAILGRYRNAGRAGGPARGPGGQLIVARVALNRWWRTWPGWPRKALNSPRR